MLTQTLLPQLEAYLAQPRVREALALALDEPLALSYLAAGEYNINYLLTTADERRLVVRVNTGSQIGQAGGAQIAYEAAALRLLAGQGIGPELYYVDDTLGRLPYGLLVMEYLPGGPLDYNDEEQIAAAATTLAQLHRVRAIDGQSPFIRRRTLVDDLAEGQGWLEQYLTDERAPEPIRRRFAAVLRSAAQAAERDARRFPPPFALVHTDVQAHNWLVNREERGLVCRLVDWERPLIDDPTYDLVHFVLPTTTRWKCGIDLSAAQQEHFLSAYLAARPDLDPADLRERFALRYRFILLRALSWCAGAWLDYRSRPIPNLDTLAKIEEYLQPQALDGWFGEWIDG
jgi:aminoglycoside phosphotransferase (APT) family kinase protein